MALQDLSLPVDVPWKLIATSKDMLADHDSRFPHAMWKSSLAVFSYDPPDDDLPDEYVTDRELTFLKVVCSITSYVPPCLACPPPPRQTNSKSARGAYQAWQEKCRAIEEAEHRSYACSGALIQVAVYPANKEDETSEPKKLAYFASFEPKKREMIEAATESGEAMTQSKSDLNVRKGTTATDSTEDLDVLTGVNMGGGFAGAQASVGVTGQWGTIKKSGSENVAVRNTDSSRETREQSSHTTSLSQLYHLLNSYHLGTNRAIFFVQPRPHTLQQKEQFTFIDGPQSIEGIQEFFLIVSRPKDVPLDNYCVEALLYTAHLDDESASQAINDPKTAETQWLDFAAVAPQLPDTGHSVWNIVADIKDIENKIKEQVNELASLWGDDSSAPSTDTEHSPPVKCDGYVTPSFISNPNLTSLLDAAGLATEQFVEYVNPTGNSSWKIDRTRGLGGYDLWEDPNNRSGQPAGTDLSKFPPEALVDVVSLNSPDDAYGYLPDYALRVRAQTWPSTEGITMYHGRIKAYYIKNDSTTQQRSVNMFVTVRGTSTCSDSPFFDLAPDEATLIVPDIAAENHINPVNVSPWARNTPDEAIQFSALPDPDDGGKQVLITRPKGNSTPSGLDHAVLGASRAKMANVMGQQVKKVMNSSLACLAQETDGTLSKPVPWTFRHSDFFFDAVARKLINSELAKAAVQAANSSHPVLDYVLNYDRPAEIDQHFPIVTKLRQVQARANAKSDRRERAAEKAREDRKAAEREARPEPAEQRSKDGQVHEIPHDPGLPVLTLADPQLAAKERERLQEASISSAFDLIGVPARELARNLGTNEKNARELRLRVLGLYVDRQEHGKGDDRARRAERDDE